MLFNSFEFLFYFLPLVIAGVYVLTYLKKPFFLLNWLIFASIFFYGEWEPWHILVLFVSISINYILSFFQTKTDSKQYCWLVSGIGFNLVLLVCFKYLPFFASIVGINLETKLALPLGISFFTFQQIAYHVDLYRNKIKHGNLNEYLLFVLFFPQLIAGPIVHYRELVPQFSFNLKKSDRITFIKTGIMFLAIGLFKKVVFADHFSQFSDDIFSKISMGQLSDPLSAWQGVFSYSLQIYFDFSGYADMAIGLGLLTGIRLPINFNSPYKSKNFREFWRRWHLTLSFFLRDYLYIALGGNRIKRSKQLRNLMITMILAGLWHGGGWTFFFWGALHGLMLIFNHTISPCLTKIPLLKNKTVQICSTFLSVSLLWVLFRSNSIEDALGYYTLLATFSHYTFDLQSVLHLLDFKKIFPWLCVGLSVVWILPNSSQWLGYNSLKSCVMKELTIWHGIFAGILFMVSLKTMVQVPAKSFVYFVF